MVDDSQGKLRDVVFVGDKTLYTFCLPNTVLNACIVGKSFRLSGLGALNYFISWTK